MDKRWTDAEVADELRSKSPLNLARQQFSNWYGKIDQAQRQRRPLGSIEQRRMEFEAVKAIISAYKGETFHEN